MDRIFTACHGTQLLVIAHLRRHLQRPPAREFLIWHPLDGNPSIDRFMRAIVADAGFDGVLDIRDIESLQPRTQGSLTWWFESARRLRRDAGTLHAWMAANGIDEATTELWADEPTHLNVILSRGALPRSVHVKIPHCFNFEDAMTAHLVSNVAAKWQQAPWTKKHIYYPWLRLSAQVDMRVDRIAYDRAYTFAMPSPWSANSVDVSKLVSIDAFAETYRGLPPAMRAEVDSGLEPIRAGAKPLVLLLLFGLGGDDVDTDNVSADDAADLFRACCRIAGLFAGGETAPGSGWRAGTDSRRLADKECSGAGPRNTPPVEPGIPVAATATGLRHGRALRQPADRA